MLFLRNVFALLGVVVVLAGVVVYVRVAPTLTQFEPQSVKVYQEFATRLLTTLDPGEAMMWAVAVKDPKLTPDDVKTSLKNLAVTHNFLFVEEFNFYKQVEAVTGQPYRHIAFLSFCDARVGKMMADYRDAYTGFMPCRIAVVEDKKGKLWLYSMNLDLLIYGGKRLPAPLKEEALRIRNIVWDIMQGAALGDF